MSMSRGDLERLKPNGQTLLCRRQKLVSPGNGESRPVGADWEILSPYSQGRTRPCRVCPGLSYFASSRQTRPRAADQRVKAGQGTGTTPCATGREAAQPDSPGLPRRNAVELGSPWDYGEDYGGLRVTAIRAAREFRRHRLVPTAPATVYGAAHGVTNCPRKMVQ